MAAAPAARQKCNRNLTTSLDFRDWRDANSCWYQYNLSANAVLQYSKVRRRGF